MWWLRRRAHCSVSVIAAAVAAVMTARTEGESAAPARILVVGDSLSAEYGLARGSGWVALLERRLAQEHIVARVVNASISGDTTSGGRSRLPALLALHRPTHVILELGGNDALRGLAPTQTQANLVAMVRAARAVGARLIVLVAGMVPLPGESAETMFANTGP